MVYQTVPPLDLGTMIQGGARFAQSMRDAEAFKLQKEDRAYAREQEQKKLDFEQKVRAAVAKVPQAKTPEERVNAIHQVAALDPKTADTLMGMEQEQTKLQGDQRALEIKQQVDVASVWKPVLESYAANPSPETLNAGLKEITRARMQGVQINPDDVKAFYSASAAGPGHPDIQNLMVGAQRTLDMWGEKPKAEPAYKIDQPVAELAGAILATKTAKPQLADPRIGITDPGWPAAFAEARAELERRAAAGADRSVVNVASPGAMDLTAPEKGRLQAEKDMVLSARADVLSIRKKVENFDGDPFTIVERGKAVVGDVLERAGMLDAAAKATGTDPEKMRASIAAIQDIKSKATMMSYKLLVSLSGKATTDREREILFDAMGDPGKMGKTRYMAALNGLDEMFRNRARQTTRTLREGVDLFLDDEDRSLIDAKIADIEARRAAKDIDQTQAAAEMQDVGQLFKSLVAESRKRQAGRTDVMTDAPASAVVKTPRGAASRGVPITRDGVTKYWNGKEWVE